VLCWLDQCRRDLVRQSPANDGKTRGTIALRSPVIDPTGTSIVRLLQRDGAVLLVRGLDSLDGTPLLDIKPERSRFQPLAPAQPGDDEISR
jgi:tRNA (Thr-GGU) A37 N-methylase